MPKLWCAYCGGTIAKNTKPEAIGYTDGTISWLHKACYREMTDPNYTAPSNRDIPIGGK